VTDLRLCESGPPQEVELDDATARALAAVGVATVTPIGPNRWELRSARKVGVVRAGALTVWIHPKITVDRLLWMLGWARNPGWVDGEPIGFLPASELVPVIAEAYCVQAERALRGGLLHGYREVDDISMVLRGRLRADEQLRRRYGLAVPLLVRYDDHLADIAENQLLRAAAARLLWLPGVPARVGQRLQALHGLLADVSDLIPGRPLPRWLPTRLNVRYHDALWLAQVVLAAGAVDHEPGPVRLDGFLVDLYRVFEDFVTATLAAVLERHGGRCQAQDPHTLDEDGAIAVRPDLVWRLDGAPAAVIDAKYKAEHYSGFPQADLYQALAYATAYHLPVAHLVYAKGNEVARGWTVRHAGVRIIAHTLDLSAPSDDLLGQVDALGTVIATASS
jgi:5-methylcytosine-specific restriction enzyme subunit McrC